MIGSSMNAKLTMEDIHAVTFAYDWAKRNPVRAAVATGKRRGLRISEIMNILANYRGELIR